MRPAVVLLVLAGLLVAPGCDSGGRKPRAKPKKAAAKAPQALPAASSSAPVPERPEQPDPPAPTWRVVSVHDGDTLRALDPTRTERKVRLLGIDAPEIGQPFGTKARDRLTALVKGKAVTVHDSGSDNYGRSLARVEVAGEDVNRRLVADGCAWHYTRYSDDDSLAAAEAEAKAARRGLWAEPDPVPPWEWRATERDRKDRSRNKNR